MRTSFCWDRRSFSDGRREETGGLPCGFHRPDGLWDDERGKSAETGEERDGGCVMEKSRINLPADYQQCRGSQKRMYGCAC